MAKRRLSKAAEAQPLLLPVDPPGSTSVSSAVAHGAGQEPLMQGTTAMPGGGGGGGGGDNEQRHVETKDVKMQQHAQTAVPHADWHITTGFYTPGYSGPVTPAGNHLPARLQPNNHHHYGSTRGSAFRARPSLATVHSGSVPTLNAHHTAQGTILGVPLKYASLLTLAVQNASLGVVMHYSRVSGGTGQLYNPSTAVLMSELIKGCVSAVLALKRIDAQLCLLEIQDALGTHSPKQNHHHHQRKSSYIQKEVSTRLHPSYTLQALVGRNWPRRIAQLRAEILTRDSLKLAIPASLYVLQNNLQYIAASNLDVATFQITYQLKILTTAFFSVLMLGHRLGWQKWASLVLLAVGVGIVQVQTTHMNRIMHAAAQDLLISESKPLHSHALLDPTKGLLAVILACFTSGLSGVYFEKVVKGKGSDLWVSNIQMSLFSLLPAILPVISGTLTPPYRSPFANFGLWAWIVVLIQACGGLITAVVIKYSDNILKGFTTSISIVLSFLASVILFDFPITSLFCLGAMTVIGATVWYNQPNAAARAAVLARAVHTTTSRVKDGSGVHQTYDDVSAQVAKWSSQHSSRSSSPLPSSVADVKHG